MTRPTARITTAAAALLLSAPFAPSAPSAPLAPLAPGAETVGRSAALAARALAAYTLGAYPLGAQTIDDDHDGPGEEGAPGLKTARAYPLEGASLEIDGRLGEEAWERATPASGFVAREPTEGAEPEERTAIRILYDQDAIYVGARMFESDPSAIRDQLVRRDQQGNFDFIAVLLDSNLDRRTGFYFQVSAAGVESDRLLFDDTEEDDSWDAIWQSAVARDSLGWSAELRIPLSQLRYEPSDGEQSWGVNFFRRRVVSNEELHFTLVSRLQDGQVSQFGRLRGLRLRNPPGTLELRPFVSTTTRDAPAEPENPFFDGTATDVTAGGEVTWGIGGTFNLNATFNPDFGQVESDPAVIDLSAFETFFEERRPFFVEDRQLFDFELSGRQDRLFFTRRIGLSPAGGAPSGADFSDIPDATTILGAAKLSGRTEGGLSIGTLAALTAEESGRAFFAEEDRFSEFVVQPRTEWGVVSLEQDFRGGDSQVTGLFVGMNRDLTEDATHRPLPGSAFASGVDFIHRWGEREWALSGFFAASHVRGDSAAILRVQTNANHFLQRPDSRWAEIDSAATTLTGAEWRLRFERQRGEHWTGSVWTGQRTPGFAINDVGFSRGTEGLDLGGRIQYQEITPGELFRSYRINFFSFHGWSHDLLDDPLSGDAWRESLTSSSFSLNGNVELLNFWRIDPRLSYRPERWSRTKTRGGPVMKEPSSWEVSLGVNTDRRKAVSFRPNVSYESASEDAGSSWSARLGVELRPTPYWEIQVTPSFRRQTDAAQFVTNTDALPFEPTFGTRHLFADVDRRTLSMETRMDLAFTPDLTFQLFAQPFVSSGDFETYKQLLEPRSFRFERFEEGEAVEGPDGVRCVGGRTCVDDANRRRIDFDDDGEPDVDFRDRDFNVRSLIVNAVLRWEFREGSRLFAVWQRFQDERARVGDFDFGRDVDALFGATAENVVTIKVDFWVGL